MATISFSSPAQLRTLEDVAVSAAGVPLSRIRLIPMPGTATEADVLSVHASSKRLCELVDGILVEKTIGSYESLLAGEISAVLRDFVLVNDLGIVLPGDGMLRLFPGRVRIPDVSFISWQQLPGKAFPRQSIASLHPDLAVEVLSEGNTAAEMHQKLHDYFAAGARLVWYLDADRREMSVYRSPQDVSIVPETGILDGGDLLPGLQLPVAKIFRVPLEGILSGGV